VRADAVSAGHRTKNGHCSRLMAFFSTSDLRAGDVVQAGDVSSAKLDDRDLRLQLSQAQARVGQARQAVRDALASLVREQKAQGLGQNCVRPKLCLNLVSRQSCRSLDIVSPIDGLDCAW
jgi:hypothetical protein